VVHRGEKVAILGPSGSGKSTLLNLISGIDLPDGGTVRVDGTDLTALSERARTLFRRRRLGFVFQFFNLLPTLTVLENLLLPVELKGEVGDEEEARARSLLEDVGLADRADTFPDARRRDKVRAPRGAHDRPDPNRFHEARWRPRRRAARD